MQITITDPGELPVSLDTFKTFLRMNLTSTAEDELLSEWLQTAVELLSEATGFVPTQTGFTLTLTEWPENGVFVIPRRPIVSISTITYHDSDGNATDLTTALRQLDSGRLQLATSKPESVMDRITVDFVAGDINQCPAKFKAVVKLVASHFYSNREAYTDQVLVELPLGFEAVARQIRGAFGMGDH